VIFAAILTAAVILLYLVARAVMAVAKDAGRQEALREVADNDAKLKEKQAAEMLKEKTVDQVIQDLNNSKF